MIKAQTMKKARRVHHYIGVFFTPAILFFASSGALQTFRLQEEKGYGGEPPAWIVWIASVHKDSSLPRVKSAKLEDGRLGSTPTPKPRDIAKVEQVTRVPWRLPMQVFVALLSIGLIVSSLLGVVIALNNMATRRASILMLVAGALLPLLLMLV